MHNTSDTTNADKVNTARIVKDSSILHDVSIESKSIRTSALNQEIREMNKRDMEITMTARGGMSEITNALPFGLNNLGELAATASLTAGVGIGRHGEQLHVAGGEGQTPSSSSYVNKNNIGN
jgi:hypothetical protein